jgi:GNAT superfamily N-acetyltransferase
VTARHATEYDLLECLRMGRAFAKAAGLDADDISMIDTLRQLMEADGLFVVGHPAHGMAGVLVYQNYFRRNTKTAQEMFWWVDVEARGTGAGRKLLEAIEVWAKEKGAQTLTMIALDDVDGERVAGMYKAAGYRPLERNFVKVL